MSPETVLDSPGRWLLTHTQTTAGFVIHHELYLNLSVPPIARWQSLTVFPHALLLVGTGVSTLCLKRCRARCTTGARRWCSACFRAAGGPVPALTSSGMDECGHRFPAPLPCLLHVQENIQDWLSGHHTATGASLSWASLWERACYGFWVQFSSRNARPGLAHRDHNPLIYGVCVSFA